jgi:cytochrome bd-type quinol oxidase subunit 1
MDALDLARWQFGITTVYHFLFVPLTISLAFIVAGFQTAWFRTGNEKYLQADSLLSASCSSSTSPWAWSPASSRSSSSA